VYLLFVFFSVEEKQIQSLKEQNHRHHMDEMMVKLKMEQMIKMTNNECRKVYSLEQQRDEITEVRLLIICPAMAA